MVKRGIGKANASKCAQLLIDLFNPYYIINSGIAGGIDESLSVGDIVIGKEPVQHDFDATAFGHAKGYLCTGERDDTPTVFRSDKKLVCLHESSAKEAYVSGKVRTGRIASGDIFAADRTRKESISHEFKAIASEMEGAAIAQTAAYAGIPFSVLRVISDLADGEVAKSFGLFKNRRRNCLPLLFKI